LFDPVQRPLVMSKKALAVVVLLALVTVYLVRR
jgi:hypothetical protein